MTARAVPQPLPKPPSPRYYSQQQSYDSYTAAVTAFAPNAWYRLGASPLVDASGNGNTLTLPGAVPTAASSLLVSDPSDGSRDFVSNQYYLASHSASLTLSPPYSVEAWVQTDSITGAHDVCTKYGSYVLRVDGSHFAFDYNPSVYQEAVSGTIATGTTYHVVVVDDGRNISIYLNGVVSTVTPRVGTGMVALTNGFYIGSGDFAFDGRIDEVALYGTALSGAAVLSHYNAGIATPAGATTPQALTATALVVTATAVRQANKLVTATNVAVTATSVRQVAKTLTATASVVTATVRKQVNKTATATTIAATATLAASRAYLRTLTATTVVVTATLVKQVNKSLVATAVVVTATTVRQVGKVLSRTVAVTATVVKQSSRLLTATAVGVTATATAIKVILKTITATSVAVTASIIRQVGKPLTVAVAVSGAIAKQVNKSLTATTVAVTASLSAIRAILKTLTATSLAVTATITRQIGKQLAATAVALTSTVVKRVGKIVTGSSSATATQTPTFISGGGITTPQVLTATSVTVTASLEAVFVPAPTISAISVQDFAPLVAA